MARKRKKVKKSKKRTLRLPWFGPKKAKKGKKRTLRPRDSKGRFKKRR